jgi:hypothetical protein
VDALAGSGEINSGIGAMLFQTDEERVMKPMELGNF